MRCRYEVASQCSWDKRWGPGSCKVPVEGARAGRVMLVVLAVCLVCLALPSSAQTLFMISGPDEVLAGTPTRLAVTVFSDSASRVTAEMVYGDTRVVQTEVVQGGVTRTLTLPSIKDSPIPELLNLTLEGYKEESLIFSTRRTLRFRPTNVSSFILTDRSRYFVGDSVKVWVSSVESDDRPYEGRVDVSIQDPDGRLITKWDTTGNQGITIHEFTLQSSLIGQWTASVTINGVKTDRNFTVEQSSAPPRFKLLVRTPTRVLVGEDVSGSVRAVYAGGKPVKGTLTVSLSTKYGENPLTQTQQIYGSAQFFFSKAHLETLNTAEEETANISASITDTSSGHQISKDVEIHFFNEKFLLEFRDVRPLKPTLHFFATLTISRFDGKPLTTWDRKYFTEVEVNQRRSSEVTELTTLTLAVPEDGNVFIKFRLESEIQAVFLKVRFESSVKTLFLLHSSSTESYIQILPTPPAQIGVPLLIDVESTFPLSELHYVVSSTGQVLTSGTETSVPFTLTPTPSWSPEACVKVYSVLPDVGILNDTARILLDQQGYVTLDWSSDQAQPGEQVYLTVKDVAPTSQVGLLVMGAHGDEPMATLDFEKGCEVWRITNSISPSEELEGPYEDELLVEKYWRRWMDSGAPLLWLDVQISQGNWKSGEIAVPDGFTSLRAAALSMSYTYGLVFTPVPRTLLVSKDFSLSLDVPSYLIRGEELVLEVKVINHLGRDIEVIVLLAQSEGFEFVLADRGDISVLNAQKLIVRSHASSAALFPVRFVTTGQMEMSVDAVSAEASDSLTCEVIVRSEGVLQSSSESRFLEVAPVTNSSFMSFSFSFPSNVVPGSQRAFMVLVGDVMTISIHHLEQLVQQPLGSGEQNMIHFAPNVYVLQYLDMSSQDQPQIRGKALEFMKEGYQRQLTFQRPDGSFSNFGYDDSSCSIWLTAFVLRCFQRARLLMSIDYSVLTRARSWLLGHQGPQGEFREVSKVIHTELHEDLDVGSVGLTAYVLIALLENQDNVELFPANVSLAKKYLEGKVSSGVVSNYSLSLAAYALSLTYSGAAGTILSTLASRADYREGIMMWSTSVGLMSHDRGPRSTQVEMTSYVMLTYIQLGSFVRGIEPMKWLSSNRDHRGGYGSTQATVVALQALSYYAAFSGTAEIDLSVQISAPGSAFHFSIDNTTYLSYQQQEINPGKDIQLDVQLDGRGFAIVQLNFFYNLPHSTEQEEFALNVAVQPETDRDHMVVSVCMRLKSSALMSHTGMVLLDVGMLSGFILSPGAYPKVGLIRRMVTFPDKVTFYLDSLNKSEVCIRLPVVRVYKMASLRDAAVLLYDYYEPARRAMATYSVKSLFLDSCDFCGQNCQLCRPGVTIGVTSHPSANQAVSSTNSTSFVIAIVVAFLLCCLFI